jgi:hypothetical protein
MFELDLEVGNASQIKVSSKDRSDRFCLCWIDDQLAIRQIVPQGYRSAHPHAFLLGGGDLVPNALSSHFTLKLCEGEQHV